MRTKLTGKYLIIDDDESLRCLLEVILESAGATTFSASNPSEAADIVKAHGSQIDGVLLDLNLDNAKGEDVYDLLIEIEPSLDFFPMSGCHADEVEERLSHRHTAGIISKPFLSADLVGTLSEASNRHQPSS